MKIKLFPSYVVGRVKEIKIWRDKKFNTPINFEVLDLAGKVLFSLCGLPTGEEFISIPRPAIHGVRLVRIHWENKVFVQRVLFL